MKIDQILKLKSIAILWYWKEWKEAEKFLNGLWYNWNIDIFDKKLWKYDLESLISYDLVIKSPWISRHLDPNIQKVYEMWKLSSWTQIFLSNCNDAISCLTEALGQSEWPESISSNGWSSIGPTEGIVKPIVIWISGTKWKSTVSSLIYSMLQAKYWERVKLMWNIGNAPIWFINWLKADDIYILELSSYQLEDLEGQCLDLWVLVNVFRDHLDYHDWYENYSLAKENIFNISRSSIDWRELDKEEQKDLLNNCDLELFKLKWDHNLYNLAISIKSSLLFWASIDDIHKWITNFNPLRHRLEEHKHLWRIWIDDSISTTPESTLAWVRVYANDIEWIILWWQDRGYDFWEMIKFLGSLTGLKAIALLPDNDNKIKVLIEKYFDPESNIEVLQSSSMTEIASFLYERSSEGGVIMLSTASPSYNLYKNFEQQWDDFVSKFKEIE